MLSVPAAVGLFTLSDGIIRLFSGPEFVSAAFTMRTLTPIVIVIPFSVVTNQQTFIPMGKEKLILFSTSVGAVTNLICNALLIPRFAEDGAAAATVLAETAVAIVCLYNAEMYFDIKRIFKHYYQYWLGVLPIPLIAIIVKKWHTHYLIEMFVIIASSAVCYFLILILMRNNYFLEVLQKILNKTKRKRG